MKDEYQQGIFVRKIELVLDEKDNAKPDIKIEYLREYFNKGVRNEAEKDLCQEKMIELCETLFDSNEIEEYCLQKGCVQGMGWCSTRPNSSLEGQRWTSQGSR